MSISPAALPRVLTIAGSDSGGGAGIQADLKTIAALGCYGMSAITSVTVQNTQRVYTAHDLPSQIVADQIRVVIEDIGCDAAKVGMLANAGIIAAVAEALTDWPVTNLVVDPVMVAKSGDSLLQEAACDTLKHALLPLARVVTPNIPEAEVLSGVKIETEDGMRKAAEHILTLGPAYVLMKGGHLEGPEARDWLYDGNQWWTFTAPRIETRNTHGTGCTFSAAIAAHLARGMPVMEAIQAAKNYLTGAIQHALPLGRGHGPLNHQWSAAEE
jgi:hydroxymethylpyrimidine/phosphomethylpyrimidine kinase